SRRATSRCRPTAATATRRNSTSSGSGARCVSTRSRRCRSRWSSITSRSTCSGCPRATDLDLKETSMATTRIGRREFLAGPPGAVRASPLPPPAIAQNKPVRIGLLTVKTGPLATGGLQMEQGTIRFLKDHHHMLAGRKVELVSADTGGNPAGTKTKTQELIERDQVDMIF